MTDNELMERILSLVEGQKDKAISNEKTIVTLLKSILALQMTVDRQKQDIDIIKKHLFPAN